MALAPQNFLALPPSEDSWRAAEANPRRTGSEEHEHELPSSGLLFAALLSNQQVEKGLSTPKFPAWPGYLKGLKQVVLDTLKSTFLPQIGLVKPI